MNGWPADRSYARHPPAAPGPRAACLLLTIGAILLAGCARSPSDDSAEAGFARDMATHHAQAVDMAFVIRDTSHDNRLRTLAYDIITTQATQRGIFMGWLQQWGLPQTTDGPRMAWMAGDDQQPSSHSMAAMDTATGLSRMAGMASDEELERLREAVGLDAEVLFLQLMIRHHEGGVMMARALIARSTRQEVVTMARSIEDGQAGEIALMTSMLAERGARPFDSLLP